MPLITIGITSFNAQDTIARAVRSAVAQDWPDIEILIVDDASRDDTRAIIAGMTTGSRPVHIITHDENKGVAAARNSIIANARGEYIAFFDDDDESAPDRVRRQYEWIADYQRAHSCGPQILCHTARRQIYPDGAVRLEKALGSVMPGNVAPHGARLVARMIEGTTNGDDSLRGSCATCSQMAPAALYRAHGGFDPLFRRCEDTEFALRLARAGVHFLGMEAPLVTQYMTRTPDKNLELERHYTKMLYRKHEQAMPIFYGHFLSLWLDVKYDFLSRKYLRFLTGIGALLFRHPVLAGRRMVLAWPSLKGNRHIARFYGGGHG